MTAPTLAAIDFGISNTDAVAEINGALLHWTRPTAGMPSADLVRAILVQGGVDLASLRQLAITGGQHRELPDRLDECRLVRVGEVAAIGRGGQALGEVMGIQDEPVLVVSAGSGTACVAARANVYTHVTGSGVGGGTLLGLSRLLLGTVDPHEIDSLALAGDPNGADLALRDVISGPIGNLPPDATAVNFGRVGREALAVTPEDLAAALVTLVGQVIGVTAINAARAQHLEHIILIGHLVDMFSIRRAIERVGEFYSVPLTLPPDPGYATAIGALWHLSENND
ncbi:MAG: Fumble domain-containing protein [Anaerolineales bacterium]